MSDYIPNYENHSIFYGKTKGFKIQSPCENQSRNKYFNNFNEFPEQVKGNNEQHVCNNQLCPSYRKSITECLDVKRIRELEQLSATLIQFLNEARNNCDMEGRYSCCDTNKLKSWHGRTVQVEHDRSRCQITNETLCPETGRNKDHSIAAGRKNAKQIPGNMDYINNVRKRKAQTPLMSEMFVKGSKFKRDLVSNLSTPNNAAAKVVDELVLSQTIKATASNLQKKPEVSSEVVSDHGTKSDLHLKHDGLSKLGNLLPECPKRSNKDGANLQLLQDKMDDTDRNINLFLERIRHLEDRVKAYIQSDDMSCDRHEREMKYKEFYRREEHQKSYDNLMPSRIIENPRSDMPELSPFLETCHDPTTTYSVDLLTDIESDIDSMSCYL